jgi:hypothetical protein
MSGRQEDGRRDQRPGAPPEVVAVLVEEADDPAVWMVVAVRRAVEHGTGRRDGDDARSHDRPVSGRLMGATGLEPATSGVTGRFRPSLPVTPRHAQSRFRLSQAVSGSVSSFPVTGGHAQCGRKADARRELRARASRGRISLQPRHGTNALPERDRIAVEMLEHHLWLRQHRPEQSLELLPGGGVGVFLTIKYVRRLLREIGACWTGRDYAAEILNEILPRLGLIEYTGQVKKPRVEDNSFTTRAEGGRHAQPNEQHAFWWRIFRLSTLDKIVQPTGAYPAHPGNPTPRRPGTASLLRLLKCQGLIRGRKPRGSFAPGSVQAAFWATGPP